MTKIQTSKHLIRKHLWLIVILSEDNRLQWKQHNCCKCFGHWILTFEIYLRFGAWDLEF